MLKNNTRKSKPKQSEREMGMGRTLEKAQIMRYCKNRSNKRHNGGMSAPVGVVQQQQKAMDNNPTNNPKIQSMLEVDELTDFLGQAEMANREFQSEHEQFVYVDATGSEYRHPSSSQQTKEIKWSDEKEEKQKSIIKKLPNLSFPRRPLWTSKTTPEELDRLEKNSFLNWRRQIAQQEEELHVLNDTYNLSSQGYGSEVVVTPFEKNIEIWKQLWRVLERSTILIQIVDARNPLYYFSHDLTSHVENLLKKDMLLLLNKSDYLTEGQREVWNTYFKKEGVNHVFFSAFEEQAWLDDGGVEEGGNDGVIDGINTKKVLSRQQLLTTLYSFATSKDTKQEESDPTKNAVLGMVGFPNVGKSSVINVLLGITRNSFTSKRVAVAAQPGKTKHFQTMIIPSYPEIILCDCPGLVFPSFVSNKADLILNSVYPIAHIQGREDWVGVVDILCRRIPVFILEFMYGLSFGATVRYDNVKPETNPMLIRTNAEDLLTTYCTIRKLYTASSGIHDFQPAARVILQDFALGKLLYCHAPPGHPSLYYYSLDTVKSMLHVSKYIQERILKQYDTMDQFVSALEQYRYHTQAGISTNKDVVVQQKKQIETVEHRKHENDSDESSEYSIDEDDDVTDEEDEALEQKDNQGDTNVDSDKNEPIQQTSNTEDDNEEVDIPIDIEILDIIETINVSHPLNNPPKNKNQHKTQKKWGKKGKKLRNKDPYNCYSENMNDIDTVVTSVVVPITMESVSNNKHNSGVYVNAGKYGGLGYTRPKYSGAKGVVIDKSGKVTKG